MNGKTLRTIELWTGLAAGVLAIVVPTYGVATSISVQNDLGAVIPVFFGLGLSVATGAALDSQATGGQALIAGLGFLLSGALPLVIVAGALALVSFGSLDVYVLPAALVALVSAVAGTYADLANGRTTQPVSVASGGQAPFGQDGLAVTASMNER